MWRAARALISCYYTALEGASPPDEISNNLNNINDLKFYHLEAVRKLPSPFIQLSSRFLTIAENRLRAW